MAETVTLDIDGARTPEYAREVAGAFYEAARVLNHLTLTPDAMPAPNDVYLLLAQLAAATDALPQLCRQTNARLDAQFETGRLVEDGGADPVLFLGHAQGLLNTAADHARRLSDALQKAQSALSSISMRGVS